MRTTYQLKDIEKAKRIGIDAYRDEQLAKKALLNRLLEDFDDGEHDVFFCLAVNMLEVGDIEIAIDRAGASTDFASASGEAALAERELRLIADEKGVPLELRRWNGSW
ncbi:MAG: hypothetical protein IJI68_00325 [Eggerthellaceae bacterium]|nr:hypothetical protein [Eggerthellaceae bacterium]